MTVRRGGRAWRVDRAHFLATTDETHCWLCHRYVDRDLPGTHAWGPTVDHHVPLMLGGPELLLEGAVLHLAHNKCNAARSNRMRGRRTDYAPPATRRRRTSREW